MDSMVCDKFKDGLASLAQGHSSPAARAHVAVCPDCAWRLAQLTRIVDQLRLPARPVEGPTERLRLVARLLGGGHGRTGARRSEAKEFALHVGVAGIVLRLAYSPTSAGWEVLGRAPDVDWCIVHQGDETPCGVSGRFRLLAPTLDETGFTLRNDEIDVEVPSAREMMDVGP